MSMDCLIERRGGRPRYRTQKTGSIMFRPDMGFHLDGVVDCFVKNLSPMGARLQVASVIGIPKEFVLRIDFDDVELPCHIIWRSGRHLGVKFNAQAQPELAQVGARLGSSSLFSTPDTFAQQSEHSKTARPSWWKVWG
jgi:hypothetical protein